MEKLKRYNQILLAILGTLAIAGLLLLLLGGISVFFKEIFRSNRHSDYNDPSLSATESADAPDTEKFTKDLVFDEPLLIDSVRLIYVIPVSQVNLKTENKPIAKADFSGYDSYESKDYYYRVTGVYNNIIVYDQKNDTKEMAFKKKVFISSLSHHPSEHYVVMEGTSRDTNKDDKLNADDLQSFFIYTTDSNRLSEMEFDNLSALSFSKMHNSDELLLEYGIDKNTNGEFSGAHEPTVLKKFDLKTGTVRDFLDAALLEKMKQQIN